MTKPAPHSTKPPQQQSAAQIVTGAMSDIARALVEQARSGSIPAIKLCFDLEAQRDLGTELLSNIITAALLKPS